MCFAFHWPQTGRLACPGARAWTRGARAKAPARPSEPWWRGARCTARQERACRRGRPSASLLPFWYERQAIAVAKGGGSRGLAPCRGAGAAVRGGSASPGRQRQGVRWPCGRSTFIPSVPQVYHIVRKAAGSANIRPARAICHSLVALAPQRTVLRAARRSFPRPIIAIRWRLAAVAKWSSYPPNVSCYCIFFELKVLMLELWVLGLLHGLVALNLHTEVLINLMKVIYLYFSWTLLFNFMSRGKKMYNTD